MRKVGKFNREEGFSLIELMIVVGIIGVLVSIAMVSFAISLSTSKKAACRSNLKIIRNQILVYYTAHDADPPSLGDLVPGFIENDRGIRCPETGEEYDYDPGSGEVSCPYHTDL